MQPTREILGNIERFPIMVTVFYVVIFGSLALMLYRIAARVRLWRRGVPGEWERDWRVALRRFWTHVLGQRRVRRKSLGGVLHLGLFSGFLALFIGTTLLALADKGPVFFHRGMYYLLYELAMDAFGVAFCVGCALGLFRRLAARPESLGHNRQDIVLLSLLLAIGLTGFGVEAARIAYSNTDPAHARWSFVGWIAAQAVIPFFDLWASSVLHFAFWWLHVALIAGFFVYLPSTRFMHAITGTLHILLRPARHPGALAPESMEAVEKTGRLGVSAIEHFHQSQLLSLDACMECGRCQDVCPAFATDKPLSPMAVVQDLKGLMESGSGQLHGATIQAETLWSCTMCQACVSECPVLIGHVDLISDLRRHLVTEGGLSGSPAQSLRRLAGQGNPHGGAPGDRLKWAEGLTIPLLPNRPNAEYLLWVGCAASYDPRAQKVARALATLLQEAGVDFAVLGEQERCTGDPARRLGDEFLFQQHAQENVARLQQHGVRKIVTPCPHCLNTMRNEYPQFGGTFEVVHHTQLLAELVRTGKLKGPGPGMGPVTLHDPCYLARVNGETQAQREVLSAALPAGALREMPRHGTRTFCCGAGGGRMWFEEAPEQRVSRVRAREAIATGASVLVTACPFCLNMMSDGMAGVPGGERLQVLDVAEVLEIARRQEGKDERE